MIELATLHEAIKAGDAEALRAHATTILSQIAPGGSLLNLASVAEASRKFDALAAEFNIEEEALRYLSEESLGDRILDDIARAEPTIDAAATPLEAWAIPLLSALAGPGSPFLSVGLLIACKVALFAFDTWAKRRLAKKGT